MTTRFNHHAVTQHRFYKNIYGAHPYYTELRNGKAHGALLLNAHGMDVFFKEGRITYKIIGGVLEFFFFVPKDAKPNSVMQSYTDLIGKPFMPGTILIVTHLLLRVMVFINAFFSST